MYITHASLDLVILRLLGKQKTKNTGFFFQRLILCTAVTNRRKYEETYEGVIVIEDSLIFDYFLTKTVFLVF